jgi:hypothetical protein
MPNHIPRCLVVFSLSMLLCGWFLTECSAQQQPPATLPAGWQQMAPTDFANAIRTLFNQGNFNSLSDADKIAVQNRGKELFSQVDISSTSLNYQTLEMLHWVCRGQVNPQATEQAGTALMARQDDWTGKPYAEVRAKVVMMMRLKVPEAVQVTEARKWVVAGGTLDQIPKTDLQYEIVRQAFTDVKNVINASFAVQWNGFINPSKTGDYRFFISPINVNSIGIQEPVKFSIKVSVAGNVILNSPPPNTPNQSPWPNQLPWISESNFLTLTAGQPVALQVTVITDTPHIPTGTLHAMLYWQGPGISKSLVSADVLTQPGTGGRGLKATYAWRTKGQRQVLNRTDPMIDFAWTNSTILLAEDMTIADEAADAMWQAMSSQDFISATVGPPVKLHPFIRNPDEASAGLSTYRRDSFLDLVLQNPQLLDPVDAKQAVAFYQSFRMGTPDKALDVFGAWAARHADLGCGLSTDRVFEGDMRYAFASMAIDTAQQLPEQTARLQNEFLQLPDGRCALPVAYTLTHCNIGRRAISTWVAFLDGKLTDPLVVGDVRVNWLLARAYAEEHRRTTPVHYSIQASWPLDGRTFLDQASQAAQSPSTKIRVAKEIVGRLVWAHQFPQATEILQQLSNSVPDAQKAILAAWTQQVAGFATADQQALANRVTEANQAYVATLKARRDKAAGRGDTAAATGYDGLINAATSKK